MLVPAWGYRMCGIDPVASDIVAIWDALINVVSRRGLEDANTVLGVVLANYFGYMNVKDRKPSIEFLTRVMEKIGDEQFEDKDDLHDYIVRMGDEFGFDR